MTVIMSSQSYYWRCANVIISLSFWLWRVYRWLVWRPLWRVSWTHGSHWFFTGNIVFLPSWVYVPLAFCSAFLALHRYYWPCPLLFATIADFTSRLFIRFLTCFVVLLSFFVVSTSASVTHSPHTYTIHVSNLTFCKRKNQRQVTSTILDPRLKLFCHICSADPLHNHNRALRASINRLPED